MVLDEKLDELRVLGRKAVLAAETPGLDPAQLRVIAPAAFGDVVEYRGDVQQPMALEAGDEAMINAGKPAIRELADGWTIVTKDHSLSAQWEHTVLVTEAGFEVLTLSAGTPPPPGR